MLCETEEHLTVIQACCEELAAERALVKEYASQLKEGAKLTERDIRLLMDSLQKIVSLVERLRACDPLAEVEQALAKLAQPYIADRERRKAFAAEVRRYVEAVVGQGGSGLAAEDPWQEWYPCK